jgi:hypothetical protein
VSGPAPVTAPAEPASGDGWGADASLGAGVPERPEVLVGAAFAGGFLLALVLRRLGS